MGDLDGFRAGASGQVRRARVVQSGTGAEQDPLGASPPRNLLCPGGPGSMRLYRGASVGGIYPELRGLAEAGPVSVRDDPHGGARHCYTLT